MDVKTLHHECRQGGPSELPITWDRIAGGGRVSCPVCGLNKLTADLSDAAAGADA